MDIAACACGAVGRLAPVEFNTHSSPSRGPLLEWRGGRIGFGRIAVEDARTGASTCPACQHRACVFMLARTDAGDVNVGT
jgi:hypothetical protein